MNVQHTWDDVSEEEQEEKCRDNVFFFCFPSAWILKVDHWQVKGKQERNQILFRLFPQRLPFGKYRMKEIRSVKKFPSFRFLLSIPFLLHQPSYRKTKTKTERCCQEVTDLNMNVQLQRLKVLRVCYFLFSHAIQSNLHSR